jgi:hypothetical protein
VARALRRLTVEGKIYVWKRSHSHVPTRGGGSRCRETFTAFLEGKKRSPLRVCFEDGNARAAGYPMAGVVWTKEACSESYLNLNFPGVARRLIEAARDRGWRPESAITPWVVEDGFELYPALRSVLTDGRGIVGLRTRG